MKKICIFFFLLLVYLLLPAVSYAAAETTLYLGSVEKTLETGESRVYYSLGSTTVVRNIKSDGSSTVSYLHSDHLGSTILITNDKGNVEGPSLAYYPYGNLTSDQKQLTIDKLYTGQKRDTSSDLYFYNARYYNPTTAHFISADSAQGVNRYAYVANNPVMRNDPSGNRITANDSGDGPFNWQYEKPYTFGSPLEKKPWFIQNELIPEVKALYGITLKRGFNTQEGEKTWGSQWSAEEIFALENLFQTINADVYRGSTIYHHTAKGSSGGLSAGYPYKDIVIISSPKTLKSRYTMEEGYPSDDPGGFTEWSFLHEAFHNLMSEEKKKQFLLAAQLEGLEWIIGPEGKEVEPSEYINYLENGYKANMWGTLMKNTGKFPTGYSTSHPNEGFAEFGTFFYQSPNTMKERYPYIYQFFQNWIGV